MLRKPGRSTPGGAVRNSTFVDSSAWIAFFSARDQHHADADRAFRRTVEAKRLLLTTNLVLAEIHRLFQIRLPDQYFGVPDQLLLAIALQCRKKEPFFIAERRVQARFGKSHRLRQFSQ